MINSKYSPDNIWICLLLLLSVCSNSCSSLNSKAEQISEIDDFISIHFEKKLDSLNYIIVIPEQGCSGCITVAEVFYKDFSFRDDILFIFNNIMSVKMLKHRLAIRKDNTIIDTSNVYSSILGKKENIYPTAIVMKDGHASAILSQSPSQSGLRTLRHYLERNTSNQ